MGWSGHNPAYDTPAWKRARKACLDRAQWRCEIQLDGCTTIASQADHVYGLANDPTHRHLRAACLPCHRQVTTRQGHAGRAGSGGCDPDPRPATLW